MVAIFEGAPKPSLLNQELTLNDAQMKEVADTVTQSIAEVEQANQLRKKILTFNQTSYSGADCKVFVNKYNQPSLPLRAALNTAIGNYVQVKDFIIQLANITVPSIGTQAAAFKRNEIDSITYQVAIQNYRESVQQITVLEGQTRDTGYNQFISNSLSNGIIQAQTNPSVYSSKLFDMAGFLDRLIAGWKDQLAAMDTVADDFVVAKPLAEIQTISISTYREKTPVRAIGSVGVKGYTRGPRTVAGSIIFTVFDRNVLFELMDVSRFDADDQFQAAIKDQLPPLDLTIQFANEYGALSRMGLYGVEFVSEGQTISIEDILLEDVVQFVARDVDPMTPVLNKEGEPYNRVLSDYNQAMSIATNPGNFVDIRASDLRGSVWDQNKDNTAAARFGRRSNPFF